MFQVSYEVISLSIMAILIIIIVILLIIKLSGRLVSFEDYWKRATWLGLLGQLDRSILIAEKTLQLKGISEKQNAMCLLLIGDMLYRKLEYLEAIRYFDQGLQTALQYDIFYTEVYKDIIQCYLITDNKNKAIELYNNLLARQDFDKNFKKLEKIKL